MGVVGKGIEVLNERDNANLDFLNQIIDAANTGLDGDSDVTFTTDQLNQMSDEDLNKNGYIHMGEGEGRMEASLFGSGGTALVEHFKDVQTTIVGNVSSVMAQPKAMRTAVERKQG